MLQNYQTLFVVFRNDCIFECPPYRFATYITKIRFKNDLKGRRVMTENSHTNDDGLSENVDDNLDIFIEDAIETGCVWGLENQQGWALCSSQDSDEIDVMPLWSQPEYAQIHCKEEWSSYQPVPIALEEFLDDWLPGMHEDLLLVGVNWNTQMEGREVEPLDLLENIDNTAQALQD